MTVRPSPPQGHQYEVPYTWDNPVRFWPEIAYWPAFYQRHKSQKQFINGKKKFKRKLNYIFVGRWRVQVTNLPSRSRFFCKLRRHNAWVHSIYSGPDAKPNRASAFWFLLFTTMVFAAVRTHFPRKNTRVYRNTVTCVTRVTLNRVKVHRLNSQHLAMVRTWNVAEVVPSGIFCLQP